MILILLTWHKLLAHSSIFSEQFHPENPSLHSQVKWVRWSMHFPSLAQGFCPVGQFGIRDWQYWPVKPSAQAQWYIWIPSTQVALFWHRWPWQSSMLTSHRTPRKPSGQSQLNLKKQDMFHQWSTRPNPLEAITIIYYFVLCMRFWKVDT